MATEISKGAICNLMKRYFQGMLASLPLIGKTRYPELIGEVLRGLVAEGRLERPRGDDYHAYMCQVSDRQPELMCIINSSHFQLISRGLIIPMPSPPRPFEATESWVRFMITEEGKAWARSEEEPIPEDILGFSHI